MKLLLQSAMIFFGTLMAAAVVALGEPAQADVAMARRPASSLVVGLGSGQIGASLR